MNHPLEIRGEHSVFVEPTSELGPFFRIAAIDGQTRLSILVLGILKVAGHFLCWKRSKVIDVI